MLRKIYIILVHTIRVLAKKVGLLSLLESQRDRQSLLYVRSLFSIYDVDDMVQLDLPWWTFAAAAYVENFLRSKNGEANVFEYGPGASTVWLAKRARQVAFVEHDGDFAAVLKRLTEGVYNVSGVLIPPEINPRQALVAPSGRVGYENCDFENYVAAIRDAGGPFDMIVIDGRARNACLKEAVKHVKPNGIILFDNSRRERYRLAIEQVGFSPLRFPGLAPALPYLEETTILTRGGT